MGSLLSLGSVNADHLVRVDGLPVDSGAEPARDLLRTSGGKAGNVAVLAARLGAHVSLLACVGDDDLAAQALRGPVSAGVDLARVRQRPGSTGYASIAVPPDGAKAILLVANANDAWGDDVEAVSDDVLGAPDGSLLVVDLEVPVALVAAGLRAARRRGFRTVLDPAPPNRLDPSLLELADHVTPDHAEAHELTGIDTGTTEGAAAAARELHGRASAAVYVKLRDGGCALATAEGVTVVEAPAVDAVDATGAGDAFAGALGWALLDGRPPVEAARVAVAASTCAVMTYGSQESYPDRDELDAMTARVKVGGAVAGG